MTTTKTIRVDDKIEMTSLYEGEKNLVAVDINGHRVWTSYFFSSTPDQQLTLF